MIFGVGLMTIEDEVVGPGTGNVGKVSGKGGKVTVSLIITVGGVSFSSFCLELCRFEIFFNNI